MKHRAPPLRFKKFMQAARAPNGRSTVALQVIKTPEGLAELLYEAFTGNHEAQLLGRIINSWVNQISKMPQGKAALCGTCDYEFSWPHACPAALVVAMPYANKHDDAIATGLCEACVKQASGDLPDLALKLWRKLMPNSEVLTEGRA